ncbi:uncharacterized protein LOC119672571 isoform X3 [Teleopsis dalmanni]|uniref:uncharacterized protein LOC119672571 isoform X2 n=1 Tax=Teleopsis dalmanni TaxID=139649 RepID=UPI0018CEA932|nr:uncharacterized protein LOC119672571 isoform X2 [Teleopsis dalmanni]XP_037939589.1 uncharacterized protein LOC119672571 isoform X3 [Teleopsis dalmanni]
MGSPCEDFNATPFPGQMMDFPSTPTSSNFDSSFCSDFGGPITSTPNRFGALPWSDECPSTPTRGFDDRTFDMSGSIDVCQNECDFGQGGPTNQTACDDSFFGDFPNNDTQWQMDCPSTPTQQGGDFSWDIDFGGGATSTPNRCSQGGAFDSSFGFGSNPFDCEDFTPSASASDFDNFDSDFGGNSTMEAFSQVDLLYDEECPGESEDQWSNMTWYGGGTTPGMDLNTVLPMAPENEREWRDQVATCEKRGWIKPSCNPFSNPTVMSDSLNAMLDVPRTRVNTLPGIEEFRCANECDETIINENDESNYFSCDDDTMTPDDTMYHSFDDSYGESDYETCPEYD